MILLNMALSVLLNTERAEMIISSAIWPSMLRSLISRVISLSKDSLPARVSICSFSLRKPRTEEVSTSSRAKPRLNRILERGEKQL